MRSRRPRRSARHWRRSWRPTDWLASPSVYTRLTPSSRPWPNLSAALLKEIRPCAFAPKRSTPPASRPTCWPSPSTGRTRRSQGISPPWMQPPAVRSARRSSGASSTSLSTTRPWSTPGRSRPNKVLLINGVRRGRGAWRARRIASTATRRLQGHGVERMALWLRDGEEADAFISAGIGALQGTYRPYAYYGRVRDTPAMLRSVEEVVLIGGRRAGIRGGLSRPWSWRRASSSDASLANRASNDLYPERMAEVARELEADGCTRRGARRRGHAARWAWARCWALGRAPSTSRA